MGTMSLFNWIITLVFGYCLWVTIKAHRDGNPNWYAMAFTLASAIVGVLANMK